MCRGAPEAPSAPGELGAQKAHLAPSSRPWPRGLTACSLALALGLPLTLPWQCRLDDVGLYAAWGQSLMAGAVPYADFAVEYPPGALVVLLVPAVVAWAGVPFHAAFLLWTWGLDVSWRLWAWRRCGLCLPGQWLYTALQVPLYAVYLKRLDASAALCAACALLGLVHNRRALWPWALIALGTLIKLFPLVLLAPMVLYAWRQQLSTRALTRRVALTVALVAIGMALTYSIAGPQSLAWVGYHRVRGLQASSSYVAWHMLRQGLGAAVPHTFAFGAFEALGPWALNASRWATWLMLLGQGATLAIMGGRALGAAGLYRLACALAVALMATAKVFSPQYVVWIVPITALAVGATPRKDWVLLALVAAVALLTGLLYPGETLMLAGQIKRQAALVARTGLLAVTWLYLLCCPEAPPGCALTPGGHGLQAQEAASEP